MTVPRKDLGKYDKDDLSRGGLTKHDLGELIRRAGLPHFIVQPEYQVAGDARRWIDWVWMSKTKMRRDSPRVVMAFEIEGFDIGSGQQGSLVRDLEKFQAEDLEATQCRVLLHQVRYRTSLTLGPRRQNQDPEDRINELIDYPPFRLHVQTDFALMADNGIEDLVRHAQEIEGGW